MKQINWQDSFQNDALEEDVYVDRKASKHSEPISYTDRFTKFCAKSKNTLHNHQKNVSSYKDSYLQTEQNKRTSQQIKNGKGKTGVKVRGDNHQNSSQQSVSDVSGDGPNLKKNEFNSTSGPDAPPIFDFKQKTQGDRKTPETWRFLNLKNKKQTGDLFKKIQFFNKKNDAKVFNFMGSRGREGVSTIFTNLVNYVNSQTTEKKILAIDANSNSPSLHKIFNISSKAPGLLDIFNNRSEIRDAIIPLTSQIFLLCCGRGNVTASGLEQENFLKLIEYCKSFFDYVFIDCGPVLSSTDALNVASTADYNFLVIQSANDQRPVIEKSKSLLLNDECKVGGVILNRVQQVIPGWLYKYI